MPNEEQLIGEFVRDFTSVRATPYAKSEVRERLNELISVARDEGRKEGIREAIGATDVEELEGKPLFDIGSEFATPRDYRRAGFNSALSLIKERLEDKLGE